ncbi:MAG TPA: DUF4123 domain-containing protein [Terriglobia bacterium]|jgi:hypothetical protein
MTEAEINKVSGQLWSDPMPPGMNVYAILDAARNEKIYPAVKACTLEWTSLYLGKVAPELEQVAPYLVKLQKDHPFTRKVIADGWTDHWGIYIWAPSELIELRQHLRKFLMVRDESGKDLVFRYYDPRVFRTYLPTCSADELDSLFGPIQEFIVSGQEPAALLRFRVEQGHLIQESL